MDKAKSIGLLNESIADELQAVHQYMYFHFHLADLGFGPLSMLFKRTAIQEMDIEANVKNIHDAIYVRERGVTRPPALFINNKLIVEGSVPTVTGMKVLIKDEMLDT